MPANTEISADFKAQLIDELVERLSISFDQKTEQVLNRLIDNLQANNSAVKLSTQSFVKFNTKIDKISERFAEALDNFKSLPNVLEEKFKNVISKSEKETKSREEDNLKPQVVEQNVISKSEKETKSREEDNLKPQVAKQLELPFSIENKFKQVSFDNINQKLNPSPTPVQINNEGNSNPDASTSSNNLEESKPSFIAKDDKPIEVRIAGFTERSLDRLTAILPEAISKPFRSWFEDLLDPLDKIAKKRNNDGPGLGGGFGFPDLGTITKGLGTIGMIGSVLTLLAGLQTEGPLKGVAKIVGTAGLKLILPRILQAGSKLLTKIPFIGSLISIGYAVSRFQSGDYIGAGIDVLSGIANLFPGPGTIIALGLDALNAFLDISGGGSSKEASVKKEKSMSGWVGKIIKWGAVLLKKVPFVGTIINLGSAFMRFKNGQIPQGILELGSAVAMLFPGIGTAISFGIDALTTMLDAREEAEGTPASVKQEKAASGWVGKVIKWATFALKKVPFIGTIINLGSAYLRFKNNQVGRGILELISAVAMLFPGVGTAVSFGIDALTTILDARDGEENQSQTKQAPQKSTGGIWETFKKWGWYAFTKLPIVGFIAGIGKAWSRIKQGQVLKGALELLSGIATTFPGLGTAISIGIDGLLSFLDSKEEVSGNQKTAQQPTENPFDSLRKAIVDKAKKWWKGTWDWVKWLARKILPDNIIKFLDEDKPIKEDIVSTEPQQKAEQTTAKSKQTDKSDFVSQRIKNISENLPKERGTSYLTGNVEAHDYLEQLKNLTPTEQQRINAAARLNPEAGNAVANKIIANKQKNPTAKQIDAEDKANKEQGIDTQEELSENKFKYLKSLNFFQRALAFTMQPNLKAQYERALRLEQDQTNSNVLEGNKSNVPTSSLPSTNKEVSQQTQVVSPIKKLPQWNQQAIKEASPEAEKVLTSSQPSTSESIDKRINELKENVNRQMEISNVGSELSTAFEEGGFESLNKVKKPLREKLKTILKIKNDDDLDVKLDELNNNVDNFKLLKLNQTPSQTLNDIKVHQAKKQREKAYQAAGVDPSNPPEQFTGIAPPTSQDTKNNAITAPQQPNSEKIKALQDLISNDNVTEAQELINQTAKEKDFVTAKSMIDEWKSIISKREASDVESGTLKNFTKNIIQSNGPLADSSAVVQDAIYDSTIKPQLEENQKKLDEAISKLKSTNSNAPISPAPQSNNSPLNEVTQASNIDSSLLQTIANNTGNSNQNLTMFANGLNQIAKALERVGEAVGEKIKIPPVVVNNSTNSEQKKVSSTEIAKQGNPAIAQFRGAMENLRPIPA